DSFADPTQKVTLILNGVDIECTVASGIVFAETYECDNQWEEAQAHSHTVDTAEAGANIILADASTNTVSGTNIFRLLKAKYKDDTSTDAYPAQKKLLKVDGGLYSYRSLNIGGGEKGDGVLKIESGFEGMGSELHLTVNGGNVNIFSQDDGINVNEDGVSVLTVNGGTLHIAAGLGDEGDGIDSNGYLVINGGTVISSANPAADSGMDSDCGSYVNGGTVVALGSAMDWAKAEDAKADQAVMNLRFGAAQSADEAIIITDQKDQIVFAYDPEKDEVMGENQRTYSGAILSAEALQVGKTYRLYVGGDVEGEETAGIYDPATVTAFKGSTRQCYSGTAIGGHGGMGGMRPDGEMGERPEKPQNEGMNFPNRQENTGIALPGGEAPQEDEGQTPPAPNEGEQPAMPPADFGQSAEGATCTFANEFTLSEVVNAFGSVSDYRHDLQKQEKGYLCTACGETFADAQGKNPLSAKGSGWASMLLYVLVYLAGAATATAVFAILLILKKRKN
ncbi:MAG: carbohydrate-binding domain-containing protein, partial [Clostridia bacterium]|nr:carbohydrate-binding domain-containing protein [Clostridia bacterium]